MSEEKCHPCPGDSCWVCVSEEPEDHNAVVGAYTKDASTRIETLEKALCELADEAQKVINEPYREDIDFNRLHRLRKAAYRLVHART